MVSEHDYELWRGTQLHQTFGAARAVWKGTTCALGCDLVRDLEQAVAAQLRVSPERVVAAATGSAALDLILSHLRLPPGAEVVVPAFGWVSVAAVTRDRGLRPVIAEVGGGLTVTLEGLEAASSEATRVWVVTHMRGQPVERLDAITASARKRGIVVVEDCAQAWGVEASARPAGTTGDFAFFSTQWNKVISSGDGGLVICANATDGSSLRVRAGYGAAGDPGASDQVNVRMSAVSAAVLLPQVRRLPGLVRQLRQGSTHLAEALAPLVAGTGYTLLTADREVGTNGITTAIGCPGPKEATDIADRLGRAGVAAYRPGQRGDLHQAGAWNLDLDPRFLARLASYVDIPTPRRRRTQRAWTLSVRNALEGAFR